MPRFDYTLTFGQEVGFYAFPSSFRLYVSVSLMSRVSWQVDLVWKRRLTWGKILFVRETTHCATVWRAFFDVMVVITVSSKYSLCLSI